MRWTQPGEHESVDFWRVYRDGSLAVDGVVDEPQGGIYETTLPSWPSDAIYTMTAVNAFGESPVSNPLPLPEPSGVLSLLIGLAALAVCSRRRRSWRSPWS